ncbi:MAG: phage tail protein [Duganella sp.]
MLSLDQFVFSMENLPWQELQRQAQWKHRGNARIGARDARQFLGPGDDTITINGVLVPEITGNAQSLDDLRAMADKGESYVLVDATGLVYGAFVIENLNENQSLHDKDGYARRIDFTLSLARVDDQEIALQSNEEFSETTDTSYAATIA